MHEHDDEKAFLYRRPGSGFAPKIPTKPPSEAEEHGEISAGRVQPTAERSRAPSEGGEAHKGETRQYKSPAAVQKDRQGEPAARSTQVYHRTGAAAKQKASLAGKNRASRTLRINLLIGGVIAVLAVCIILAAVMPGLRAGGPGATPAASSSSSSSASGAASASGGQFTGTVLPLTADAGAAYVEETLFLGDSNTKRLMEYGSVTGLDRNTCIGVEGMGIQEAGTSALVRFEGDAGYYTMTEAVAVLQPRRVVITFGTNNIGGYTAEMFTEKYEVVLGQLEESYPYADLIIGAVPPVDQYCSYSQLDIEVIGEFNEALEALARRLGHKFLNWDEALASEATGYAEPRYTVDDGVHISEDGARAMIRYFRTHSYITEDTRPGPLGAIPQRLPIAKQATSGGGTAGGIPAPAVNTAPSTPAVPEPDPAPPVSTPASTPVESTPASTPAPAPSAPAEPDPGTETGGEEGTG